MPPGLLHALRIAVNIVHRDVAEPAGPRASLKRFRAELHQAAHAGFAR